VLKAEQYRFFYNVAKTLNSTRKIDKLFPIVL
jgi:hypothetical protein